MAITLTESAAAEVARYMEAQKLEEGTVKSKLHRARTTFMKRMKAAQDGSNGEG